MLELLVVVVILGLVAAFVLPTVGDTKEKAYVSAMKNDARNVANFQELYFNDHDQYASTFNDLSQTVEASLTDDVTIVSDEGDQQSFRYVLGHAQTNTRCVIKTVDSNIRQACGTDNTINTNVSGGTADFSLQEHELAFSNTQSFELLQAAGIQPLAADIPSDAQLVWHFGDGTTISGQALTHTNVSHTYAESGNYDVEVDVEYPNGKTAFAFSRVSANVLDADFTWTPTGPSDEDIITFDGSASSGAIDEYDWFVDGVLQNNGLTYETTLPSGDTDVSLVLNLTGSVSDTVTKVVSVGKTTQAAFTLTPNPVDDGPNPVEGDGTSSTGSGSLFYDWQFEDNGTWNSFSTDATWSHNASNFSSADFDDDNVPIRLIVTDGSVMDTAQDTLTIQK